jgi:hypothetical protein
VTPVPALAGEVATGGRLDLAAALAAAGLAAPAPAPAPPAAMPQTPGSAPSRSALTVALRILRARLSVVRGRGLRVTLTVSKACRITVVLRVNKRTQRRLHLRSPVLGRAAVNVRKGGMRTVTVKLSARARSALRRASRLRVTARAVAVDADGDRSAITRAVTLRR